VILFYGTLGAAGLFWIGLRTGRFWPDSLPGDRPATSLALGFAAGLAVVLLTRLLLAVRALRWVAIELRRLLGPVTPGMAFLLAAASAVGEEVFFRGAMQPVLGYGATSLLFGLVHVGPDRRFLPWTAFAVASGFLLGWLLERTGSLLCPMAAHGILNFLNLLLISRL
jgi:hypothetical protein